VSVTPLHYTPVAPARPGPADVLALVTDYWGLAQRIAATEFVPKGLRHRPEAVLAALLSGAERGLGPMHSLRAVHVIEGTPTLSAEAMRALVLANGHEIEILESTAQRATVVGRRAGSDKTSIPFTWTLDRARRARLINKDNWQKYPEDMLLARASAELCHLVFPDVIAGLAITEEVSDELTLEEPPATVRRSAPRRRQLAPAAEPPPARLSTPAAGAPTATSPVESPPPMSPSDLGDIPGADRPSWVTETTTTSSTTSSSSAPPDRRLSAGASSKPETAADQPADADLARRIHAEINRAFPDADAAARDRYRHALVAVATRRRDDGAITSSAQLNLEEQLKLSEILAHVHAGRASVTDEPDDLIRVRLPGGWWYVVDLEDPPTVTGGRGDTADTAPDDEDQADDTAQLALDHQPTEDQQ
jgi:hypothetical protein